MGMHKIIFGTIVFFSLAFLAACGGGGSGSAGSAGAKGDTGTAGAKGDTGTAGSGGSGAVPSAGVLALTASNIDSNFALGSMATRIITISGHDNYSLTATPDWSKVQMYGYLGTSSTTKASRATTANMAIGVTASLFQVWPIVNDGIGTAPTITPTGALTPGDGSITHLIICPGNEAGDALRKILLSECRLVIEALELESECRPHTTRISKLNIGTANSLWHVGLRVKFDFGRLIDEVAKPDSILHAGLIIVEHHIEATNQGGLLLALPPSRLGCLGGIPNVANVCEKRT